MKFLSKKEAFETVENQQSIPIDSSQQQFQFTRKWFRQRNQVTWSTFFPKKFSHRKPVNMIQIGVFEGADLIWLIQNVLGHPDSRVVAIDPWLESRKLSQDKMDDCYNRAQRNLHHWRKRIELIRAKSQDILPNLIENGISIGDKPIKKGQWNLIVVDGDHNAPAVYSDAMNSFELVKKHGWIVFDDYYNRTEKKHHVQEGINEFLVDHEDYLDLEWQHRYSLCLKKRRRRKRTINE